MLKALPKTNAAGFTLVELMIAIVVMAILTGLAMPSFVQMMRNSEIRAAAESVRNGIQRARAEAVTRNTRVNFILGKHPNPDPDPPTSWTVDYETPPLGSTAPLDSRSGLEGSKNVTVAAWAADATAATTVTFNNLGQVMANTPPPTPNPILAQIDLDSTAASKPLGVIIGAGGSVRVCVLGAGPSTSPRSCVP
jgi:type IV fimbrial biogenesis protein FimT